MNQLGSVRNSRVGCRHSPGIVGWRIHTGTIQGTLLLDCTPIAEVCNMTPYVSAKLSMTHETLPMHITLRYTREHRAYCVHAVSTT